MVLQNIIDFLIINLFWLRSNLNLWLICIVERTLKWSFETLSYLYFTRIRECEWVRARRELSAKHRPTTDDSPNAIYAPTNEPQSKHGRLVYVIFVFLSALIYIVGWLVCLYARQFALFKCAQREPKRHTNMNIPSSYSCVSRRHTNNNLMYVSGLWYRIFRCCGCCCCCAVPLTITLWPHAFTGMFTWTVHDV